MGVLVFGFIYVDDCCNLLFHPIQSSNNIIHTIQSKWLNHQRKFLWRKKSAPELMDAELLIMFVLIVFGERSKYTVDCLICYKIFQLTKNDTQKKKIG